MLTRRQFNQSTSFTAALALSGCSGSSGGAQAATAATTTAAPAASTTAWHMPDESAPHARTWMAFGASQAIWGSKLLPEVQRNLASIARAIAQFEPVSMLVRSADMATAKTLLAGATNVTLVTAALDDLWLRDTGPCFVLNAAGAKSAVNFNFNGWGKKQAYAQDSKVAALVAQTAGTALQTTRLVLEGGCFEVDGQGTAILTESCVLNSNRNPGLSKADFEAAFMPLLGLKKIIWLPGIAGKDITDGHTDFYARFAQPGVVVAGFDPDPASYDHAVTQRHLDLLAQASDAQGRALTLITLEGPASVRDAYSSKEFAAGYVGYYVCNGAVIAQEFGDAQADATAKAALQRAFPGRAVVQLNVDGIAAGGGSIHCTTQQEPL
jgi:agmatine deiminase